MQTAKHYISGRWLPASPEDGAWREAFNPANSEAVALFAEGTASDAREAVAAARHAFECSSWKHSPRLRAEVLLTFADRLEHRKEQIADWLVTLNGKLRPEALGEIQLAISELRYYAGLARNLFGRILEVEPGCFASLEREAAGVAAIILPWNAPVALLIRSLAPALAAGCSVVVKPAHQTALVSNLVLECLLEDPRLPTGLVNSVIESGAEVSRFLCRSEDVDVISFTGSTRVGKLIAEAAAGTLKRLSLELGGKAPALVFSDCDMDRTVAGVARGSMVLAGQQCTAISRVIVDNRIYAEFSSKLKAALNGIRLGFGTDPAAQMGCMIDRSNRDRIAALVAAAEKTDKVLLHGTIPGGKLAHGAFIHPSLVEVEDLGSPLIQQELFGPLLVIERFNDEADAVMRANATRYSLAASVWTADSGRARRMASALRFGTVWLNTHNRLFPEAETGGYRDSGYGKLHGAEGLNDFLQTRHFYYENNA